MATVQIGTGTNRVKVAQAISRVQGDTPDWLSLENVAKTATNLISGPCAKVNLPGKSTLQAFPSANIFMSKIVGSDLYDIGRFIVRPSKGSNSAKIVTDTAIVDYYTSHLAATDTVHDDLTGTIGYLDPSDSSYKTVDFTTAVFDGNMLNYVGPHLTFRNDSIEHRTLYFGTGKYEVDNTFVDWPTNTFITFKLIPNAYL